MPQPQTLVLEASRRGDPGTAGARAARRDGMVPAVLYGGGGEPVALSLPGRALAPEIERAGFLTRVCEVALDGERVRVLPRAVQRDPVSARPLHVDLQRVDARTRVRVFVPMRFLGEEECQGLREGGVLNVVRHEVEVVCRAESIPESLDLSLSSAQVGDSLHIDAVPLPDGVKPVIERNFTVATIAAPSALRSEAKAAAEAAEAAAAEPEGEGEAKEGEAGAGA